MKQTIFEIMLGVIIVSNLAAIYFNIATYRIQRKMEKLNEARFNQNQALYSGGIGGAQSSQGRYDPQATTQKGQTQK